MDETKFKLKYGAYTAYWSDGNRRIKLDPKIYSIVETSNGVVQTLSPYILPNYSSAV